MSDVIISPNMLLPVPIVSQDPGPDFATNINACMSVVDQHNHSANSGVQISQDGINLTASGATFDSLSFNGSNAFDLRSARFIPQPAALGLATDLACIYSAGVDLYFNDASGNQIRLTQGGSIVGTAGSITGLPSGTASASFAGGTFVWQSATNTAANMDAGSYILRNSTASSFGLTLNPPNAMGADYDLYLPSIPGATKIMAIDTSGNMSGLYTVDNLTIDISGGNEFEVKTGGLTAAKMAASAVTDSALNIGILPTFGTTLIFALTDQAGATPSATSPVKLSFRSTTAAVAAPLVVSVTAANSITLPAVAGGLGFTTAVEGIGYIYAMYVAGAVELAVSHALFDDGTVASSTSWGTGPFIPYTSNALLYSPTARTNVPIKLLARFKATQTGTNWGALSELSLWGPNVKPGTVVATYYGGTMSISSTPGILNFSTKVEDTTGSVTTGASWKFTAPEAGVYAVSSAILVVPTFLTAGDTMDIAVYKNGTSYMRIGAWVVSTATNVISPCNGSISLSLASGDYIDIRAETSAATVNTTATTKINFVSIVKVA